MDTSREQPGVVRRTLCRIGMHRARPVVRDPEPCLRQWRCAFCRTLLWTRGRHDYGPAGQTGNPCVTLEACVRCGEMRAHLRHEFYEQVLADDMPVAEQPRHRGGFTAATPCDYAVFCRRCGQMDSDVETRHDWDWDTDRTCRTCGTRWVDDGDD